MLEPLKCPHCKVEVNQQFAPGDEGAKPTPGCLSICSYCFELSLFNDDLRLIPIPPDLVYIMKLSPAWPGIQRQIELVKKIRRVHPASDET